MTTKIEYTACRDCLDYLLSNITAIEQVPDHVLIKGYYYVCDLYPGLHPDGFDDVDSGWPDTVSPICKEMWRRVYRLDSSVLLENMYPVPSSVKARLQFLAGKELNTLHRGGVP